MKISAMPAGNAGSPGVDLGNVNVGATASSEKLAAAKAIAQGLESQAQEPEERERPGSVRRITMKTNFSTNRDEPVIAQTEEAPAAEGPVSTTEHKDGQAQTAVESTQPLSPQLAALAKQRRELQVMKQELAKEKAAIEQARSAPNADMIAKADLIANPLKIFDLGVTHDKLTEAILADQSGLNPEIKSLKEELKTVKSEIDKRFVSAQEAQEEAALNNIADDIESLSKEGDRYEFIRKEKAMPLVLTKIYNHWKKTGQVLDTEVVMDQVETKFVEKYLDRANVGKVKSKIMPSLPVQTQPQSEERQMKTLTNRDNASPQLSRRARALAAFSGNLRK